METKKYLGFFFDHNAPVTARVEPTSKDNQTKYHAFVDLPDEAIITWLGGSVDGGEATTILQILLTDPVEFSGGNVQTTRYLAKKHALNQEKH